MELYDILTISVATGALLVAFAGLIYTVRSNKANRRSDNLQEVRRIVTSNVAKFNGIMTGLEHKQQPTAEDLIEPTRLYAEVRDVYRSFRHSFNESDRNQLDALLQAVENKYEPDDLGFSLKSALPLMPRFLNELEVKLNG